MIDATIEWAHEQIVDKALVIQLGVVYRIIA